MPSLPASAVMPPHQADPPGWLPPWAAAALAWRRQQASSLLPAYGAVLLVFLPLLSIWRSVVNKLFNGRPPGALTALMGQQSVLSWWVDALVLTLAFGAWRHAQARALARQLSRQAIWRCGCACCRGSWRRIFCPARWPALGN